MSAGFYSGCAEGVVDKLGEVRCGGESLLGHIRLLKPPFDPPAMSRTINI